MKQFPILLVCLLILSGTGFSQTREERNKISKLNTFRLDTGDLVMVLRQEATFNRADILKSIHQTIREELVSRGYRFTEDSIADMSVTFVAEVIERVDVQDVGPLGQQPANTPAEMNQSQVWSRETLQGTLRVGTTDASGKPLWRGETTIQFGTTELIPVMTGAAARSLRKFPRSKK